MIYVYHEGSLIYQGTEEKFIEDNQGDEYVIEQIQAAKEKGVHEFSDLHIGNWKIYYEAEPEQGKMNIYQAAKIAIQQGKCITRKTKPWTGFKIKPTDSPDCCIAFTKGRGPRRGWEPKARDLIAEDWEVCD